MKVFLPAIAGRVPEGMLRAISAFLDFCYLVRPSQMDEDVLDQIENAVRRFHQERQIFIDLGIRDDFLLPRQHALAHYRLMIQMFGAPNGLCSSITESKHIKAVKQPWRRSSRNHPLGEMLLTNQRIDKIAAARVHFESRGMLNSTQGNPLPGRRPIPQVHSNAKELAEGVEAEEVDAEDVEGVTSEGDVRLPRRAGTCIKTDTRVRLLTKDLLQLGSTLKHSPISHNTLACGLPQLEEHIRRFLYAPTPIFLAWTSNSTHAHSFPRHSALTSIIQPQLFIILPVISPELAARIVNILSMRSNPFMLINMPTTMPTK